MKKIIISLLILMLAVISIACGNNRDREIYISGSKTVEPIVAEIAAAFEENYPEYKVVIEGIGSSAGVSDTSSNSNHIGMSSRSISEKERSGVESFLLCKDPIVLIVNNDSTLDKISKEELTALYIENTPVGDITQAISRLEWSTTRAAFAETTGIGLEQELDGNILIAERTSTVKNYIMYDQTKLGYISQALVDDDMKVLAYSDGGQYFDPSIENIQRDRYPIYRPFYLVVPKSILKGGVPIFLDFCRSDKAKEIILEAGLVPLG